MKRKRIRGIVDQVIEPNTPSSQISNPSSAQPIENKEAVKQSVNSRVSEKGPVIKSKKNHKKSLKGYYFSATTLSLLERFYIDLRLSGDLRKVNISKSEIVEAALQYSLSGQAITDDDSNFMSILLKDNAR